MTAIRSTSRHPSAGELVRRLDRELDPRAEARLAAHLERCSECQARAAELAERSREASRLLAQRPVVDEVTEARHRSGARRAMMAAYARRRSVVRVRRGWTAAAAVAALVVLSLTVDPLRAWVRLRLVPAEEPVSAVVVTPLPPAVVGRDGSVIAFEPAGPTFELSVETPQRDGELLLQVSELPQAMAQVTNAGTESLLVLPRGLRIENSAASRASYRVTLPSSVEQVVVRIGEGEARTIRVGGPKWEERIGVR